jgi:tetratricopeptide (TPR) repeat protein
MTGAGQTPGGPSEIESLVALAHREVDAGRLAAAAEAFRRIVALTPDSADAHNNLGNVLIGQGDFDQAAAEFSRAVKLNPDHFEARNNLGAVLRRQGKLEEATAHLGQALALKPDYAEACYNLGNVLKDQGKFDQAGEHYGRAAALKPDLFQAHNNLGNILQWQGKLDQARASFFRVLAINPGNADAHNNLGKVLEEEGKFDEAVARYEQAIALKPDHAEAHYNRANLKHFRAGDAELARLESLAADAGRFPADKTAFIHFALGKALEDVGDYSRAFEQWRQGNALKRRDVQYDEAAYQRTCRLAAEVFDAGLLDRFAAAGDPSAAPIFVLGMPRSGSTLVEQILASHPQVFAGGELKNLKRVACAVGDSAGRPVPYPVWLCATDANILRRLGQMYLASLPTPTGGQQRIVDKAPGNFLRVGLIRLILPNARIIHTVRDPIDTCVSCFSRLFTDLPFSYDLAELGRYYRSYHELMRHWRSVLPADAMLDVSYEELVADFEPQARRLIDYCGLPWDDRCLSFHKTSRPIATSSNAQVRRPLYRSSIERWRRYETQLQPLLAELDACRWPN